MSLGRTFSRSIAGLGGMLVAPRSTLGWLVRDPPRFEVLLPWMFLATATAEPVRVGQALLLSRVAPIDGLLLLVQLVFSRFGPPVLGVFLVALVRVLVAPRGQRRAYDRWSSTLSFSLAPLFLLTAVGGGLEALDLGVWFLPHHQVELVSSIGRVRAVVAYAWPLVLALLGFLVPAPEELSSPPAPSGSAT